MKKKYIIYALIGLILIQIYSIYNLRRINKALIEANESSLDFAKMWQLLSLDYLASIKSEGYKLPEGIILETRFHEKVSLDSLLTTGPKFLVRYSISACPACLEQQIPEINNLSDSIGKENIIFISPYDSPRNIEVIEKKLQPKYDIYMLTGWNSQIENIAETEMFIITPDRVAKHIYIPRKEMPTHLSEYLEFIKCQFNHLK